MSSLEFVNAPRDIKIDRNDDKKYQFLRKIFDTDYDKDIFLLALKIGFAKNINAPVGSNPLHKWQLSTFEDDNKREMIIIANTKSKDIAEFFDGVKIVKICEEYANAGIKYLYNLFTEEINKDNIRIIEDLLEEIRDKVNGKLFFVR